MKSLSAAITTMLMCFASSANAIPVIGVAVDDFTSPAVVGVTEYRSALGGDAIKYFIPLTNDGSGDCTYGVSGCGLSSDTGKGGDTLSMNLMFNPLLLAASTLTIEFEDLDLIDANDPSWFLEDIQIFDVDGISITPLITDISSIYVSGNYVTQTLSLDLGVLTSDTFYATLNFTANSKYCGKNTPEYLIASIEQESVPEPSIVALLGIGIIGMVFIRRRVNK